MVAPLEFGVQALRRREPDHHVAAIGALGVLHLVGCAVAVAIGGDESVGGVAPRVLPLAKSTHFTALNAFDEAPRSCHVA